MASFVCVVIIVTMSAKVIASIEDPVVIQKILEHLKNKGDTQDTLHLPDARAPPQSALFD